MSADTPALPGEAPDPVAGATAIDALLREVAGASKWITSTTDAYIARTAAPRLAAIVRVLREAMTFYASGDRNAFRCESERLDPAKGTGPCCERVIDAGSIAADALRRADEIAGGIRGSVTPGSGQTGEAHETV